MNYEYILEDIFFNCGCDGHNLFYIIFFIKILFLKVIQYFYTNLNLYNVNCSQFQVVSLNKTTGKGMVWIGSVRMTVENLWQAPFYEKPNFFANIYGFRTSLDFNKSHFEIEKKTRKNVQQGNVFLFVLIWKLTLTEN